MAWDYELQRNPPRGSALCTITTRASLILQLYEPIEVTKEAVRLRDEQMALAKRITAQEVRDPLSFVSSKG